MTGISSWRCVRSFRFSTSSRRSRRASCVSLLLLRPLDPISLENFRHGRLPAEHQEQRLFHRLWKAPAHRTLRHLDPGPHHPESSQSWPRNRALPERTRPEKSGQSASFSAERCSSPFRSPFALRPSLRRSLWAAFGVRPTGVVHLAAPTLRSAAELGADRVLRSDELEPTASPSKLTLTGTLCKRSEKLSADNLSNLSPKPLHVALRYSDPPITAAYPQTIENIPAAIACIH